MSAEALPSRPETPPAATWAEIRPKAKKPPMMNQAIEATSATRKGVRDGRCWSAKISPPIEGTSSLAGGGEPALRRRACGAARANELLGRSGGALGSAARRIPAAASALPRRLWRLGRLLALDLGPLRLSVDPSRLRCSALSRSARDVRLGRLRSSELSPDFPLGRGSSLREDFALCLLPPLPQTATSLALAP